MIEVTRRVLDFAQYKLREGVQKVLNDPIGYAGSADDLERYVAEWRLLAADLGEDFDDIIVEVGTDHEVERLRELLGQGKPRRPGSRRESAPS